MRRTRTPSAILPDAYCLHCARFMKAPLYGNNPDDRRRACPHKGKDDPAGWRDDACRWFRPAKIFFCPTLNYQMYLKSCALRQQKSLEDCTGCPYGEKARAFADLESLVAS